MGKRTFFRSAFVLATAVFTTLVSATLDLEVTSVNVSGAQVSVVLHNPSAVDETARIQVTVLEAGGSETLLSAATTFAAGSTQTVTLTASHTIVGIIDSPEPINP